METQISVNIATLKAQFSKYLRSVRAGEDIVVLDHKMPIAKIVPVETKSLASIKPKGSFAKTMTRIKIPRTSKQRNINSLTLLLEERGIR